MREVLQRLVFLDVAHLGAAFRRPVTRPVGHEDGLEQERVMLAPQSCGSGRFALG